MTTQPETRVFYENIHDYVRNADISHYEHTNTDINAPEILIEAFQPFDDPNFWIDPDFGIDSTTEVIYNNSRYIKVRYGELDSSYLNVSSLYDLCYIRYILYPDSTSDYSIYTSNGVIYKSEKAAKEV